jgi:hypothetical protein
MSSDLIRGWDRVRVKKTRQNKRWENPARRYHAAGPPWQEGAGYQQGGGGARVPPSGDYDATMSGCIVIALKILG